MADLPMPGEKFSDPVDPELDGTVIASCWQDDTVPIPVAALLVLVAGPPFYLVIEIKDLGGMWHATAGTDTKFMNIAPAAAYYTEVVGNDQASESPYEERFS